MGNGVLKEQMDSLTADGWTDVPTLKMMNLDDMYSLQLSQLQRVSAMPFSFQTSLSVHKDWLKPFARLHPWATSWVAYCLTVNAETSTVPKSCDSIKQWANEAPRKQSLVYESDKVV